MSEAKPGTGLSVGLLTLITSCGSLAPELRESAIMSSDVTREEFEARVGVLEREVEGEKMVTRHILEQTRRNGDDLAAVKARLNTMDQRFDRLEGKVEAIDRKVEAIDRKVDNLAKALPDIVGDAVREANRGRGKKR